MVKISALPPEAAPSLTDSVPLYDAESGTTKKTTLANVGVALGSSSSWLTLGYAPNTVTANGNKSYTLVFNSINLTSGISPGMRLLLPRTVTAPTQCADLESGSSQYFSKTSPSGLSFTTTFTCAAWIKLESYGAEMGIIARRNADTEGWGLSLSSSGQVQMTGLRIASNNKNIQSYQSVPLNKWVHVAATIDMTVGDTTAQKIWIDGVEVPRLYALNGTATALVQGTTALVVGSTRSAGSNTLDGKIAQAAVFSSQLSDATIKAMMNQTMTGAESTVCAAYTLSNSLLDLTANDNDLTAQGSAVATNADTPFTNSVTGTNVVAGTTNYGIIMAQTFSTNTTLTVQVPEGETLPTTGGIGTVSYSTQKIPYGFPGQKDKWNITTLLKTQNSTTSNATYGSFISGGWALTVPIGEWYVGYDMELSSTSTTRATFNLSPTSIAGVALGAEDTRFSADVITATNTAGTFVSHTRRIPQTVTSAASTYVIYTLGATTGAVTEGDNSLCQLIAENAYI